MTGFLLAMAYRSWQLNEHDEVQDDLEDRRIARLAAITTVADSSGGEVANLDEAAAETRDETELSVEEHWLAGDEDEL
jgi:multicomponent Na+:H+ antiporter subunit C